MQSMKNMTAQGVILACALALGSGCVEENEEECFPASPFDTICSNPPPAMRNATTMTTTITDTTTRTNNAFTTDTMTQETTITTNTVGTMTQGVDKNPDNLPAQPKMYPGALDASKRLPELTDQDRQALCSEMQGFGPRDCDDLDKKIVVKDDTFSLTKCQTGLEMLGQKSSCRATVEDVYSVYISQVCAGFAPYVLRLAECRPD